MRIAYFDCFSGISGDMVLGALLHAGAPEAEWRESLSRLNVPGYSVTVASVVKEGISALDVHVELEEIDSGHGRHLSDIRELLNSSGLPERVGLRALGAFTRIAEAEAKIHDMTPDTIHFHEVGAIDAIVDIAGAAIALDLLDVRQVYSSALPLNGGWVECAHGSIPLPAPAAMELLKGFRFQHDERRSELITPTGAALLAEFVERDPAGTAAAPPPMVVRSVGYGAGKRNTPIPNLLRVVIGEADDRQA
ncbi:MAG TPA: LarC family nickel insertion protein [Chthonomonadales bacterium]|nr:LarC family nickel insertion protein [Chthonomonadales bacterium]